MTSHPSPHRMFTSHSDNLRGVCRKAEVVFVCPLCFKVFSAEELSNLGIGHVWPRWIRKNSEEAKRQQVLLCGDCNSQAESNGDAMMQEIERIRRYYRAGKAYKPRRIQVVPPRRAIGEPATVCALVDVLGQNRVKLTLERNRKTGRLLSDPRELQKLNRYLSEGGCDIVIYPYSADWPLAQAGWLTSAYLLAFYAFGYRYIFQACLDPVREYIADSFVKKVDDRLDFQESRVMSVRPCSIHFSHDPQIGFFIPTKGQTSCHIEVSFLDYHVRLPSQYTYRLEIPEEMLLDLQGLRGLSVNGSNHMAHEHQCDWDVLFGEPDYCIEGDTVIRKHQGDT